MSILSSDEVNSELNAVQPVPALEAIASPYDYCQLTSRGFELLNYSLFAKSGPFNQEPFWDTVVLAGLGTDAGRDITLLSGETVVGIVQCKRHDKPLDLPAVFRELVKCLLLFHREPSSGKTTVGLQYFLVSAKDPARTVVDFFSRPKKILQTQGVAFERSVHKVLEDNAALRKLDTNTAKRRAARLLSALTLRLLRPVDIDEWMVREKVVAGRFFQQRVVVDNAAMSSDMEAVRASLRNMERQVAGVPLVTDVDLRIIKEYVERVPGTHRLSFGFATLFGFPREMFAEGTNIKDLLGPVADSLTQIYQRYMEWMHSKVWKEAERVAYRPEVLYTVHPFARQIIISYLTLYVCDLLRRTLLGNVIGEAVAKVTNWPEVKSDEELLEHVCQEHIAEGHRYLKGDYSRVVGEGDLLEMKMRLIEFGMRGIKDGDVLEAVVGKGRDALKPHLDESAAVLRGYCSWRPSIFLMGSSGVDRGDVLEKTGATLKAMDKMRKRGPAGM